MGPNGSACVIQTNHDPWRAKEGAKYYLNDQDWVGWAAGDELLLDTKERYACAMQGIKGVAAKLGARPVAADGPPGVGGGVKEGVPDAEVLLALTQVLRTEPVKNRQTVYGVIMIPALQHMVPVN